MTDDVKRSEKHEEARRLLPAELLPVFEDLVTDYKFFATVHHRSPFVSYVVLAELVKSGWKLVPKREAEEPST